MLTWVIMPRVMRGLYGWLYRGAEYLIRRALACDSTIHDASQRYLQSRRSRECKLVTELKIPP